MCINIYFDMVFYIGLKCNSIITSLDLLSDDSSRRIRTIHHGLEVTLSPEEIRILVTIEAKLTESIRELGEVMHDWIRSFTDDPEIIENCVLIRLGYYIKLTLNEVIPFEVWVNWKRNNGIKISEKEIGVINNAVEKTKENAIQLKNSINHVYDILYY